MSHLVAVILAGGGGTRLWPVSRRSHPKQVLRISGDRSLFTESIDRLTPWLPLPQILVAASGDLVEALQLEVPDLGRENFVLEPQPKGTAAVLGLAAVILRQQDPEAVMAVLTSDHAIQHPDRLRSLLLAGCELALSGRLVTLGIPPEAPDTGYGYIRRGESLGVVLGEKVYAALQFKEKPDAATAREYVDSGEYYWNSGMFLWRPERLLDEIEHWMPDLHRALSDFAARKSTAADEALTNAWRALAPQTIDYGIMEHASDVAVLDAAGLGWSDIGSWDRVYQLLSKDASGNAAYGGQAVVRESSGNLIVGDAQGGAARLFVLQGVRDLVLIDTGDVLLVCRRDQSGLVREIVEQLDRSGLERFLA